MRKLAWAIAAVAGCAGFAPGAAIRAATEYELYSWRCEPEWCYALLPGTTPRPAQAEVLSRPDPLRQAALLAEIARLPQGAGLRWYVPFIETRLAYPPPETVAEIRRASYRRRVRFYGPEGPLAEVEDAARAARRGWGERVYYLDHRWVALPDFEIRYLRTDSQGSQPHAVFSEFELRHGDARQTIRTDPGFGAWTPTRIEFAGRQYVLEVDTSDVLRTGALHGDLYAWTAREYDRRLRRRYPGR